MSNQFAGLNEIPILVDLICTTTKYQPSKNA